MVGKIEVTDQAGPAALKNEARGGVNFAALIYGLKRNDGKLSGGGHLFSRNLVWRFVRRRGRKSTSPMISSRIWSPFRWHIEGDP